MAARKASPAVQFVEDFDHVTIARTVAYRAGHVVEAPSDELLTAAGARVEPYAAPEKPADLPTDGE